MKPYITLVSVLLLLIFSVTSSAQDDREKLDKFIAALFADLESKDLRKRTKAIETFGFLEYKGAVPALIKLLDDLKPDIRLHAAKALGKIKDRKSVPALSRKLGDESEYAVRCRIAEALGDIGDKSAVSSLIRRINVENNGREGRFVKYNIIRALGNIGCKSAVELITREFKDGDYFIANCSAHALVKINYIKFTKEIVNIFTKTNQNHKKVLCAFIIYKISNNNEMYDFIFGRIDSKEYQEKRAIINVLGYIADDKSVVCLGNMLLQKEMKAVMKTSVVLSLGESQNIKAVPYLINCLKDDKRLIRGDARLALSHITGKNYGDNIDKWIEWYSENKTR